jgi:hypothetical protein
MEYLDGTGIDVIAKIDLKAPKGQITIKIKMEDYYHQRIKHQTNEFKYFA